MSKHFETVEIAGVELLANFSGSDECLKIELAIATTDGIKQLDCLVPHGLEEIDWDDIVQPVHKKAAIEVLSGWINDGLLTPTEWRPLELRYFPKFRGYANFWSLDQCVPVSDIDLLDEAWKSASIYNLLKAQPQDYLGFADKEAFRVMASYWKREHQEYLNQKAKDFASFWCDRVGFQGTSGDGMIDAFFALAYSTNPPPSATQSDRDALFAAIYNYAIAEFDRGSVPFLDTDYGVGWELSKLLKESGLSHLARSFPMKTWLHLNFDDLGAHLQSS